MNLKNSQQVSQEWLQSKTILVEIIKSDYEKK